jgi:hypothetical protein
LKESTSRRATYKEDFNKLSSKESILVLSVDFKQCISLPLTSWQAGLFFYKSKLNVNCFGIVDKFKMHNEIEADKVKRVMKFAVHYICIFLLLLEKECILYSTLLSINENTSKI